MSEQPFGIGCLVGLFLASMGGTGATEKETTSQIESDPKVLEAQKEAEGILSILGIKSSWNITRETIQKVSDASLDEGRLIGLLERMSEKVLRQTGSCAQWKHPEALLSLIRLVGELGSSKSYGLLLRLDERGLYQAGMALERILTRSMGSTIRMHPCTPPSEEEVVAAKKTLTDFPVFRVRNNKLKAEPPNEQELEDLSYFLVATQGSGFEVGKADEQPGGAFCRPGSHDEKGEELLLQLDQAKLQGDIERIALLSRKYLETLGFPGPIQTGKESNYAWGGARYSYVMRDLALASELLGQFEQAADLYRRANPGGGACGTSVSVRWQDQIEGLIRSKEQLGQCRAVIAERLLSVDGTGHDSDSEDSALEHYGPTRLRIAGFDLLRLYRGALVTVNRELPLSQLREALSSADAPWGPQGLKRLESIGPEAWESRVLAIEGLADQGERQSLPILTELLGVSIPKVRLRIIKTLGTLAEKPPEDPCGEIQHIGMGSISNIWERQIRSLGRSCETHLSEPEADFLTNQILPFSKDPDPKIREAVAEALGKIGSPLAIPILQTLTRDPYFPEGVKHCQAEGKKEICWQPFPVQEAATKAIENIEKLNPTPPLQKPPTLSLPPPP